MLAHTILFLIIGATAMLRDLSSHEESVRRYGDTSERSLSQSAGEVDSILLLEALLEKSTFIRGKIQEESRKQPVRVMAQPLAVDDYSPR